jgi:hypothetical protein
MSLEQYELYLKDYEFEVIYDSLETLFIESN